MSGMMMGDDREFIALDWVKDEISETLLQAQAALQLYLDKPNDSAALKRCLSFIHQVYGSLHIAEIAAAALLAEEMEILVQRLIQQQVAQPQRAAQLLLDCIAQFPQYLTQLQEQRDPQWLRLVLWLNDLRAVQQEKFFTENNFFLPNLNAQPKAQPSTQLLALETRANHQLLNQLQPRLAQALQQLAQAQPPAEPLHQLLTLYARLEALSQNTPQAVVWQSASALVENLQAQQLVLSPAILTLLLQTQCFLDDLVEDGWITLNQPAPTAFLKNALFYIALSQLDTECNRHLRQQFKLAHSLNLAALQHSTAAVNQSATEALAAVNAAVHEEVSDLAASLQQLSTEQPDSLTLAAARCRQIADTLAILGQHALRKVMLEQAQRLAQLIVPDHSALLEISGACVYVSASLAAQRPPAPSTPLPGVSSPAIAQSQQQAIKEARAELERAKEGVIQFIAQHWERAPLTSSLSSLRQLSSSLALLNLSAAAEILTNSTDYLQRLIATDAPPQWSELDAFADIIASLDYYLEGLQRNLQHTQLHALAPAVKGLQQLGYSINLTLPQPPLTAARPVSGDTPVDAARQIHSTFDKLVIPPTDSLSEVEALHHPKQPTATWDSSESTAIISLPTAQRSVDPSSTPFAITDLTTQMINPPAAEAPEHLLPPPADEAPVDLELQEIFTEEAHEVLETIQLHYPAWRSNPQDQKALTELRRGFHTLKGSGRMVRALIIGELAWAVENLLNRVLDNSLQPSAEINQLLEQVIDCLPALISEYAQQQQRQSFAVDCLAATAHALAKQQPVPQFVEPSTPQAVTNSTSTAEEALDKVLLEIFQQEARSHLQALRHFIQAAHELLPCDIPEELQRALHTLKGSAAMAKIHPVLQLAIPLERMAKEYKAHLLKVQAEDLALLEISAELLQRGLDQLNSSPLRSLPGADSAIIALNLRVESAIRHKELLAAQDSSNTTANQEGVANFLANCSDLLFDSEELLNEWKTNPAQQQQLPQLIDDLRQLSTNAQAAELLPMQQLATALADVYQAAEQHRLSQSSEFFAIAENSHEALMGMMDEFMAGLEVTPQPALLATLQQLLQGSTQEQPSSTPSSVSTAATFAVDYSDSVLEIFLEEALELIENASMQLERWQAQPDDHEGLMSLMRELHTLKGGAAMAGLVPITELAHELESLYEGLLAGSYQPSKALFDQLQQGQDGLDNLVDQLHQRQALLIPTQLIQQLADYRRQGAPAQLANATPAPATPVAELTAATAPSASHQKPLQDAEILALFISESEDILQNSAISLANWELKPSAKHELENLQRELHTLKGSALMADITPVADLAHELEFIYEDLWADKLAFGTEVQQLLRDGQDTLQALIDRVREHQPLISIHDLLHRIQSYRAQGPSPANHAEPAANSNLSADFKHSAAPHFQRIQELLQEAQEPLSVATRNRLVICLQELKADVHDAQVTVADDSLQHALTALLNEAEPLTRLDLAKLIQALAQSIDPDLVTLELKTLATSSNETMAPTISQLATRNRVILPFERNKKAAAPAKQQTPAEQVRVSSDHLEELVNLAGETSIFRGRVEQQVSDFSFTLTEMEATIDRVRDQLRRLDTETQAQILSRHQLEVEQGYEDFDPLEMDRHSQMQQLSRALFESASDLLDLKETLANRVRDTETLLLQQSRVNTELQEGLMRTRMVTFDRLLPRLRRIVRQVSTELGKKAELSVSNAEGEVDRTMLERMIAPLEHMLRNALDHGIETPEARRLAGKPEVGHIHLELAREGADVMLILQDDGDGVNIDAVKEKAIERGWIQEDTQISDQDAAQLILRSGLTTANTLSQISGRGVGMDAVYTQIKQLGGNLDIETERHSGTKFTVRLPFTVSINRALMVYSGDDLYAIPLNTIEGITQIERGELQRLYQQQQQDGKPATFRYADQDYELTYIGSLLNNRQQPKLAGEDDSSLPLILLRSPEYAVAVQVDALASSREIVVKSLGPQFADVPGISGATILGDGRVVIILDLMAKVRDKLANGRLLLPEVEVVLEQPTQTDQPHIMVIDDSITVRKVTSRFLERNNMQVSTAKDGVDALNQLQEKLPDLLLLDIEMPRMDGFEVAKLVRHDQRLKHLPIVMITSRTGDKHRERALSLGVNEYLGKPYQEEQLLEVIQQLLDHH
ncbi:Hpt domain-containing protein [Thiopseudomonas alkaliphila]|uniref:Hpt domain-containing protein n=1 Tax=Thiopseudomonas alkaliphila TaxID=1697053 RepID=UPI002577B469|nr:Hpt domain-containing protein [Thiopseudomonas alkaliphila]MDM1708551.1 Hpt domain-containing protein [Thiopseudomonas alkaliphila]